MAKNRRRNRRRLHRPYVKMWEKRIARREREPMLVYYGSTALPRDGTTDDTHYLQSLIDANIPIPPGAYYISERLQLNEGRNYDPPTQRPMAYGTVRHVSPVQIDSSNLTWQVHNYPIAEATQIRIYNRGEFDEAAIEAVERDGMDSVPIDVGLERMLVDHQQRLRNVRAVGGNEEKALELNFRELRLLLDNPAVWNNNEMFAQVASAAIAARTDWELFKDSLKLLTTPPRDAISCSCGHRQLLDPTSDDYQAGLAFCDECSAGYELEFNGDTLTDWRAFSAE